MNAYAKESPVKKANQYQEYLLYKCGIRDCQAFHRKMIAEGYLEESSLESIIQKKRVAELKPVLEELGLSASGSKNDLIKRIMENASESYLRKKFPEKIFAISDKGRTFLSEHEAYVLLHKYSKWGVSWQEFDARKKQGLSTGDVLWRIFNQRIPESNTYGRFEYYCMYELLVEEGKRRNALEMLLRVMYIDVSGAEATKFLSVYSESEIQNLFDISIMFAPAIMDAVPGYKDVYDDAMVDRLFEWKLPINVCKKQLFLDMIHSLMSGDFDEKAFLKKLRVSFDKTVIPLLKKNAL